MRRSYIVRSFQVIPKRIVDVRNQKKKPLNNPTNEAWRDIV